MTDEAAIEGGSGPLAGVRVVEVAAGRAVAYAGRLFALCGAEVVRIEPPSGDAIRREGPFPGDIEHTESGSVQRVLNGGKRSVVADLHCDDGVAVASAVIAGCDLVLGAARTPGIPLLGAAQTPGDRLLGNPARFAQRFPGVTFVSISPFGAIGPAPEPYARYRADSHVIEALAGCSYVTGDPDREPLSMGVDVADHFAGVAGFEAALVALLDRHAGVARRFVDVSTLEALAHADHDTLSLYAATGAVRRRHASAARSELLDARDLLADEHLRARGGFPTLPDGRATVGPPFRLSATPPRVAPAPQLGAHQVEPWSRPREAITAPNPPEHDARSFFERLRVVDLTHAWSGAAVTRTLADLGADVVQVERATDPERARGVFPAGDDRGGDAWNSAPSLAARQAGTRSIALDLDRPEGRELLHRLLEGADALVAGFTPRVLASLGFAPEALCERYPRLVMVSISGFGQDGPRADDPALGSTLEAASGVSAATGSRGRRSPYRARSPGCSRPRPARAARRRAAGCRGCCRAPSSPARPRSRA